MRILQKICGCLILKETVQSGLQNRLTGMAKILTGLLSGNDLCLLRGDRCLFQQLSFALNPGELLLVEGANGSGKTSLLRGIAGLLDFETGHIGEARVVALGGGAATG